MLAKLCLKILLPPKQQAKAKTQNQNKKTAKEKQKKQKQAHMSIQHRSSYYFCLIVAVFGNLSQCNFLVSFAVFCSFSLLPLFCFNYLDKYNVIQLVLFVLQKLKKISNRSLLCVLFMV